MNEKGCEDDLILQRFLDEELHPEAAEMVFFHIENCSSCGERLQDLKAVKAFCRDELGREDEFEGEFTHNALLRVRSRLHTRGELVDRHHSADAIGRIASLFDRLRFKPAGLTLGWRIATITASLVLAVAGIAVWFAFSPSSTISASEILSESERRTAVWENQPDKVLHWVTEENFVNHGSLPDGKYRSFRWRDNTGGKSLRLFRKYNEDGVLVWAAWTKADGSEVVYTRFPEEGIKVYPANDVLREYAAGLGEKSRQALEKFIERSIRFTQQDLEARSQIKQRSINRWLDGGSVQIIRTANAGKAFRVHRFFEPRGGEKFTRGEMEYDIAADSFMRNRLKSVRYFPDGKVAIEDSKLEYYQETSIEDFNEHDLSAEMRKVKRILLVTPEEVLSIAERLEETKRTN